ncbi:blue-light-activated protein [mine drainage metagenome]|uniref:histidine kinase n=1 Tax=mine drainage metagenome TaxID=410659 RepID=A0A1J5SMC8_9ZZZZ
MNAPPPSDESERLKALEAYEILDTPPEAQFDELAALAAEICGMPIALVTLVDADRQWFKARVGFDVSETPREHSFCAHAFAEEGLLLVPDATKDARFADNPLVTGDPHIRFYAGAPLVTESGHTLGTLCVLDRRPRELPERNQEALRALGRLAMARLELRRKVSRSGRIESAIQGVTDLLRGSERRLREVETAARMAARLARIGAWGVDLPSLRVQWSDEVRSLYGVGPEFIPSLEGWLASFPDGDRARLRQAFDACAASGEPFDLEAGMNSAPRGSCWVRVVGEAVQAEDRRVVQIRGAIQDITAQKRDEDDRRRLGDSLATTLESITDAFMTMDRTWRFTYLNREAERVLQRSRADLLGRVIWDEFAQARGSVFESEYERALRERVAVSFDAFYAPLATWFSVRAYPTEDGLAVYFRDVTRERQATEALRTSEGRLRLLARATNDALWELDPQSGELWWNDGYERNFGHRAGAGPASISTWERHVHPEDLGRVKEGLRAVLAGGGEVWTCEYRFRRSDGGYAYVLDRGYVLRNAEGAPVRVVGGLTDLTARKSAEEEARRSTERLSRVVEILQEMANPHLEPGETMTLIAARAQELSGADGAMVLLAEGDDLVCTVATGLAANRQGCRLRRGRSLPWLAVLSDSPTVAEDVAADDRIGDPGWMFGDVRSMAAVPFRDEREACGVLVLGGRKDQLFGPADVSNLQILVEAFGAVVQRQRRAVQLRESEAQYRLLFAGNPNPMWVFDRESLRFVAVNEAAVKAYGYSEADFLGMSVLEVLAPEVRQSVSEVLRSGEYSGKFSAADRHVTRDGRLLDVEEVSDDIEFRGRRSRIVLAMDVTKRVRAEHEAERANRATRMLSRCNEALIRADSEEDLLSRICTLAVEVGDYRMAWVGYAQDDVQRTILPKAHAGEDQGYLASIRLSWADDSPSGAGPAARVVRSGIPVVVPDIAVDPGFVMKEEARQRGFRSVVCLPLKDGERTFGILVLYVNEARIIPAEEMVLLRELADNLAYGILTLRAREERRRTHDAVLAMAKGVSASTGVEFLERLTSSMVEALGADGAFVAELVGAEGRAARTLCAVVDGRRVPDFEYALAGTPCGQLRTADLCVVASGVQARYPDVELHARLGIEAYVGVRLATASGNLLGLMFVLFRRPLAQQDFVVSTMRIFASRVAAEMERQSADAKTREQAALLDKAQDAIVVRDLDHRIGYWNRSAERLYGWTAGEVLGRSIRELIYAEPSAFDRAFDRVMSDGEWVGEIRQVCRDGRVVAVEGHWTLVRDEAGKPVSILAINTDITERKKLEEQFLRAQRMESLGTLAGGIAHDLNNLLAPITMGVGLLKRMELPPKGVSVVENIERSAGRGADLVRQVLSFARGVDGVRLPVALQRIVEEVATIARTTFPKNIVIETSVAPGTAHILAEPTQVNQVFLNLCLNARDAMPSGGRLTLSAENVLIDRQFAVMTGGIQPGRYVVARVADTGTGIPAGVLDRIFEPFFTTKELGKGTGLGLSTALGIVRSHGGFVDVRSEQGAGSTFLVYLPAHESTAPAESDERRSAPLPRGSGELVLVVDDEVAIRDITRHTLESFGYRVLLAEDGAQAVSVYAERRDEIALVVTDMMMPVMDGVALAVALRRLDPGVRVVGMSGLGDAAQMARATEAGVRHFIPKPFSAESVLRILRAVLSEDAGNSAEGSHI